MIPSFKVLKVSGFVSCSKHIVIVQVFCHWFTVVEVVVVVVEVVVEVVVVVVIEVVVVVVDVYICKIYM